MSISLSIDIINAIDFILKRHRKLEKISLDDFYKQLEKRLNITLSRETHDRILLELSKSGKLISDKDYKYYVLTKTNISNITDY